jgi:hypothetical protein
MLLILGLLTLENAKKDHQLPVARPTTLGNSALICGANLASRYAGCIPENREPSGCDGCWHHPSNRLDVDREFENLE